MARHSLRDSYELYTQCFYINAPHLHNNIEYHISTDVNIVRISFGVTEPFLRVGFVRECVMGEIERGEGGFLGGFWGVGVGLLGGLGGGRTCK